MTGTDTTTTTLASQLAAKKQHFLSTLPPAAVTAMHASSAALAARYTPAPLPVGAPAPPFELPNASGATVSLSALLKHHSAVVLTWYRGSWCPYCNLALRALTQANAQIEGLGAKLVCLSPETPDESLTTAEKNDLKFEVLSDDGLAVAEKYGVVFTVGDDVKDLYKGFGIFLDDINGNAGKRAARLPVPATFVLNKEGKVVYSFADLDYTKRAEPAVIIDAVKSALP